MLQKIRHKQLLHFIIVGLLQSSQEKFFPPFLVDTRYAFTFLPILLLLSSLLALSIFPIAFFLPLLLFFPLHLRRFWHEFLFALPMTISMSFFPILLSFSLLFLGFFQFSFCSVFLTLISFAFFFVFRFIRFDIIVFFIIIIWNSKLTFSSTAQAEARLRELTLSIHRISVFFAARSFRDPAFEEEHSSIGRQKIVRHKTSHPQGFFRFPACRQLII